MNVAILGCDCLIGSYLTRELSRCFTVDGYDKIHGHDLTDENIVRDIFRRKRYDAIVNCFAWNDHVSSDDTSRRTILDQSIDTFADCMNVNVTSLFMVCREYARSLIGERGIYRIVNFGASTGIVSARTDMYDGSHKSCAYSTSKAAVIHMTRILATHLLDVNRGIRVNCISPGGVEYEQPHDFKKKYGLNTPWTHV